MRALTLWPEWAWAVHHLDKDVENRGQAPPPDLVGFDAPWVALHAGAHIGGRPAFAALQAGIEAVGCMAERAGWHFECAGDADAWAFTLFRPLAKNYATVSAAPIFAVGGRSPDKVGAARRVLAGYTERPISTGAILGVFRITKASPPGLGVAESPWRVPEQFGLRLRYHPCSSPVYVPKRADIGTHQGWWSVPADIEATVLSRRSRWAPG